jgi:hypothetical protein
MGLDVHCTDNEGNTPMHVAAYEYSYIVRKKRRREGEKKERRGRRVLLLPSPLLSRLTLSW